MDQPQLVRGLSVAQGWGGVNAYQQLGAKPAEFVGGPQTSMGAMPAASSPLDRGSNRPWHPDNGLFWVMALAAVTLGLVGASTSIRVGPFKASAGAGKT